MNTVIFYSFRGGSGRTTVLANVAVALSRWGFKVCMLDLDFGAPGLTRWEGFRPFYADFGHTLIEYIQRAGSPGSSTSCPIPLHRVHAVHARPSVGSGSHKLDLIRGALWLVPTEPLDIPYFYDLEKLGWPATTEVSADKSDREPTAVLTGVQAALQEIENSVRPDYLLIDLPPGVGFGLNLLPTIKDRRPSLVFTSRPTLQSNEGFFLMSLLGELGLAHQIIPVLTFVPPTVLGTHEFRRRLLTLEKMLNGRSIRHFIPLIPDLGVEERILTAASELEEPDAETFWQIAMEIAERTEAAPGYYRKIRQREELEIVGEPSGVVASAIIGAFRCSQGFPGTFLAIARHWAHLTHEKDRVEQATEWLRCFLEEVSRDAGDANNSALEMAMRLNSKKSTLRAVAISLGAFLPAQFALDLSPLLKQSETPDFIALKEAIRRASSFRNFPELERGLDAEYYAVLSPSKICHPLMDICSKTVDILGKGAKEFVEALLTVARSANGAAEENGVYVRFVANLMEDLLVASQEDLQKLLADGKSQRFVSCFGSYEELSLETLLRWEQVVCLYEESEEPTGAIYKAVQQAAWGTASIQAGSWQWPRYVPIGVPFDLDAKKLEGLNLPKSIRNDWFPPGLKQEFRAGLDHVSFQLGPLANRALFICEQDPSPGLIDSLTNGRPGSRIIVIRRGVSAVGRTSAPIFMVAPPPNPELWKTPLIARIGDHEANGSKRRGGAGNIPTLTMLIEDQAPGRALRDVLSEHAVSEYKINVRLESFERIQELISDAPSWPEESSNDGDRIDIIVMNQPRLEWLKSNKNLPVLRGRHGHLLSLATGFLVYRKDLFEDPIVRKAYFKQWQRGQKGPIRLAPPRTFDELLEKAAFFDWLGNLPDSEAEDYDRVKVYPGLRGLGLQDGLGPCAPQELPKKGDATWFANWSQWSMLSRMLLGPQHDFEYLDDSEHSLFKLAQERFTILHAFAAEESWKWSWDELRRHFAENRIAMTVTWNDTVPLFEEFIKHRYGSPESILGYSLLALHEDREQNGSGTPSCSVDGYTAVLLSGSKADIADDLFSRLGEEGLSREFALRGGAPLEDYKPSVNNFAAKASPLQNRRRHLELSALRYGVPRPRNPKLDPGTIKSQAYEIALAVRENEKIIRNEKERLLHPTKDDQSLPSVKCRIEQFVLKKSQKFSV